jgi:DNA polymerase II small subunit/DNA polymerase delta subunit B
VELLTARRGFNLLREKGQMGAFDYRNFDDRRQNSQNAKAALLEKFKARPPQDDPDVIAKAKQRQEIAQARDDRARERERIRVETERKAAEEKRLREEAELKAQIEREEAEATALAARKAQEAEERKAARDARYAARKARVKIKR